MSKVNQIVLFVLLCMLGYPVYVVVRHIDGWATSVDVLLKSASEGAKSIPPAMDSLREAADTSNMTSTETLNLVGSSVKLVDHVTKVVDSVDVRAINQTIVHLDEVAISTRATMDQVAIQVAAMGTQTTQALRAVDTQVTSIGQQVQTNLGHLMPVLDQSTVTLKSVQMLLDVSVTDTLRNIDTVTIPTGKLISDLQDKAHEVLYPPKQPWWKKVLKGIRTFGPLVYPAYWGFRMFDEIF